MILRAITSGTPEGPSWEYAEPAGTGHELEGPWEVQFLRGGPAIPAPFEIGRLGSWTEHGEDAQRFAGTALYKLTFGNPVPGRTRWQLDLGDVRQSARVRLNGQDLGGLITPPFRVVVGELKPSGNVLEVEVTNVAANRIRDLDRRGVNWKTFHDINFVNLNYRPFDASDWPLTPSGLLGPVRLIPLAKP